MALKHGIRFPKFPLNPPLSFFSCDIQERFRTLIHEFPSVVHGASTLIRAAAILQAPVYVTEQYPKAFQHTVTELQPLLSDASITEKMEFSMLPSLKAKHPSWTPATSVLFGIEAHACVQQTALDLLRESDHNVFVVVDAVSSQRMGDRAIALDLLARAGATLTTTESLLLMLCGSASHPHFKQISKLLIEHNNTPSKLDRLV
jgi:hypothetical protein